MTGDAASAIHPFWEDVYEDGGQLNLYPWDVVVAFLLSERPNPAERPSTSVLEVACGAGNNLWFGAREGFRVAGLDGSDSAIDHARRRLESEGLEADLRVGDFLELPWEAGAFDLVVDRAGLTYCGLSDVKRALGEIHRVMRPGGRLLFTPYSTRHGSGLTGRPGHDGLRLEITEGALAGAAPVCLYDRSRIDEVLADGWRPVKVQHVENVSHGAPDTATQAEWRVVAERR